MEREKTHEACPPGDTHHKLDPDDWAVLAGGPPLLTSGTTHDRRDTADQKCQFPSQQVSFWPGRNFTQGRSWPHFPRALRQPVGLLKPMAYISYSGDDAIVGRPFLWHFYHSGIPFSPIGWAPASNYMLAAKWELMGFAFLPIIISQRG